MELQLWPEEPNYHWRDLLKAIQYDKNGSIRTIGIFPIFTAEGNKISTVPYGEAKDLLDRHRSVVNEHNKKEKEMKDLANTPENLQLLLLKLVRKIQLLAGEPQSNTIEEGINYCKNL